MVNEKIMDIIDDDTLFADGFDSSIIGVASGFDSSRLVYDAEKMARTLVEEEGMSYEEAWEYLEFNTFGAWVGDKTPIYIELIEKQE